MIKFLKNLATGSTSRVESPDESAKVDRTHLWHEDCLLGFSDTDARWYYERRAMRNQG